MPFAACFILIIKLTPYHSSPSSSLLPLDLLFFKSTVDFRKIIEDLDDVNKLHGFAGHRIKEVSVFFMESCLQKLQFCCGTGSSSKSDFFPFSFNGSVPSMHTPRLCCSLSLCKHTYKLYSRPKKALGLFLGLFLSRVALPPNDLGSGAEMCSSRDLIINIYSLVADIC